jgi:hypothetical protein
MRSRSLLLPALLLLTGCPWITQGDHDERVADLGTDDTAVEVTDADDDGYASNVDCDDASAAVYPGADETCNGIDDDCDDEVDEGDAVDASTFFADDDGDGFGDAATTTTACELPSGHSADDTDCDDGDSAVHPDADELCDTIDNDCDDEVDEDDAVDAPTWYADDDGDGFGDAEHPRVACDALSTEADNDQDCDDLDAAINPDADEICDEIDNDCDDEVDEDEAIDASTWHADSDGDSYGDPDTTTPACTQPSGYIADDSDCDDSDSSVNPAGTEICDEVDNDCDGDTDESDAADAATWYGDGDADGFGDVASTTPACTQPSGYVADATDCDDGDGAINPGATEICDEVDNDCDGTADGASAVDATDWYTDADSDGYGDPTTLERNCLAGSGHVTDNNDCDDGDAAVNPGADESCDAVDNDCDGDIDEDDAVDVLTWYADADADSYGDAGTTDIDCEQPSAFVADSTDCDDSDAAINPASEETCDGADNDCDGATDEDDAVDALTWYRDADADSYGDEDDTTIACSAASGYVADAGDCDDLTAAINPDATEVCDEVDNDCDGTVDGATAVDATDWYLDADADGYGDPATLERNCLAGSGHVADNTDCDDSDAGIYPGADEYCDGADGDCDGVVDSPGPVDGETFYLDSDGDGYGIPSSTATDCSAPSGYAVTDDDCDDADAAVNPAASEIWYDGADSDCDGASDYDQDADGDDSDSYGGTDCDDTEPTVHGGADEIGLDGLDNDCDGSYGDELGLGDAHAVVEGDTTGDRLGWAVASAGDVNGDSYDDIMIAAPNADSGAGAVLIFHGPVSVGSFAMDEADVVITGSSSSGLGSAIASVGDMDSNGYDDIILGASSYSSGKGAAYLIHGPISSYSAAGLASLIIEGDSTGDYLGDFVGGGTDVDGDGSHYPDLLIGAPLQDYGYTDGGRFYVASGAYTGTVSASGVAGLTTRTRNAGAKMGSAACTGDFDADGVNDLVVAGSKASVGGNFRGAAYLLLGPVDPIEYDFDNSDDYDGRVYGLNSSTYFGASMVNVGDVNGDSIDDLLVGAPRDYSSGSGTGAAFLFLSPWADGVATTADATFYSGSGEEAGWSVAAAGDLDASGKDDWIVGVVYDNPIGLESGAAYILLDAYAGTHSSGSADGTLAGEGVNDLAGWSVAGAGDTDADGIPDLLVGAPEYDEDAGATYGAGQAYLITGLAF